MTTPILLEHLSTIHTYSSHSCPINWPLWHYIHLFEWHVTGTIRVNRALVLLLLSLYCGHYPPPLPLCRSLRCFTPTFLCHHWLCSSVYFAVFSFLHCLALINAVLANVLCLVFLLYKKCKAKIPSIVIGVSCTKFYIPIFIANIIGRTGVYFTLDTSRFKYLFNVLFIDCFLFSVSFACQIEYCLLLHSDNKNSVFSTLSMPNNKNIIHSAMFIKMEVRIYLQYVICTISLYESCLLVKY